MDTQKSMLRNFSTFDLSGSDEQEINHDKEDAFIKDLVKTSTEFNLQFFSFYYELVSIMINLLKRLFWYTNKENYA